MNAFLKQRCLEDGLGFVDYYSVAAAPDGLGFAKGSFTHEGVHPTAECYARMAHELRNVLRTMA